MNMYWILYILLGYLLGSLPFALIIGKLFYKTDVRNYGSGNLGGTNAGRVLGKKAGISVIACDVLKVVVAVGIVSYFDREASIWAGFAAAFGHCYPIFAGFRVWLFIKHFYLYLSKCLVCHHSFSLFPCCFISK